MNLWARKLGLIFLSALPFFSCQKEELNTIGLPPENNLGIFFADIPLNDRLSLVWAGDISSRGTGSVLVGNYIDPYLGQISSSNYSELVLPSVAPGKSFGEDATFDSLVLEMRIRQATGNNLLTNSQHIDVHQLSDSIPVTDRTYTNASAQEYGMKLGETDFTLQTDSIGLTYEETGLADSLEERALYDTNGEYIYMTRIHMDDAFGQTFFNDLKADTSSTGKFGTSENFSAYINGLRVSGAPTNSAIIDYNPADTRTRLIMYYSQTVDDTLVQRNVRFSFSQSISYRHLEPNDEVGWTGDALMGLNSFYSPFETTGDDVFIQGGSQLFLKLDLSNFRNFADTLENPIVQGAELLFNAPIGVEDSKTDRYPLPSSLLLNVTSEDSLANENISVNPALELPLIDLELPAAVNFNSEDNLYRIEIPVYLQTIINKENRNDQLILTSGIIDPSTGRTGLDNRTVNRVILHKDNIKFRLYYSIPNAIN